MAYTDYPRGATREAKRALAHKEKNGSKCGTSVGWARARQLAERRPLSDKDVKDIHSFLSRAKVYDQGWLTDEDGNEICGSVMYAAWGGDAMAKWAERKAQALRNKTGKMERRTINSEIASKEGQGCEGHGIVFNELTHLGENVYERILADGFNGTGDVVVTFNHNWDKVLGREASGTAKIEVTERGVKYVVDELPDTTYARDLKESLKRGDVAGSSFTFMIEKDSWKEEDGKMIRTVEKYKVYEMGPVTLPAYQQTDTALRMAKSSLEAYQSEQEETGTVEVEVEEKEKTKDFTARHRKNVLEYYKSIG